MFSSLLFFLENFVWFWMAVFLPINSATKWGQTQDNRKFLGKCLPSQMFPHNKSMCNPTYSIYTHSQWQNECVSERDRKTKDLYSSWANTDRTYRKTGKPDTACRMRVCVCVLLKHVCHLSEPQDVICSQVFSLLRTEFTNWYRCTWMHSDSSGGQASIAPTDSEASMDGRARERNKYRYICVCVSIWMYLNIILASECWTRR